MSNLEIQRRKGVQPQVYTNPNSTETECLTENNESSLQYQKNYKQSERLGLADYVLRNFDIILLTGSIKNAELFFSNYKLIRADGTFRTLKLGNTVAVLLQQETGSVMKNWTSANSLIQ